MKKELDYSSSVSQSIARHSGHLYAFGLGPSNHSRFVHLPQRTDVRIGSSKVVSTLNIGLPASGIAIFSGAQEDIACESKVGSPSMDSPAKRRIIPPIDSGAASDREKREASAREIPDPMAMQIPPAITVFNRLFWGRGPLPMALR